MEATFSILEVIPSVRGETASEPKLLRRAFFVQPNKIRQAHIPNEEHDFC